MLYLATMVSKLLWLITLISVTQAMKDTFPWMNNYVACILRMPVYNYEPTILMDGTYSITTESDEFAESDFIKVYVDAPKSTEIYKGLFLTVLEDGISRGEWMPIPGFLHKSCDHSPNSALTEMDKSDKTVRKHVFSWKAPKCDPNKKYEIIATVIRDENEFQPGIVSPLKCKMEKTERLTDYSDDYYDTYSYYGDTTTRPSSEMLSIKVEKSAEPTSEPERNGWENGKEEYNENNKPNPENPPQATPEVNPKQDRESPPTPDTVIPTAEPTTTPREKTASPEAVGSNYYGSYSYEYTDADDNTVDDQDPQDTFDTATPNSTTTTTEKTVTPESVGKNYYDMYYYEYTDDDGGQYGDRPVYELPATDSTPELMSSSTMLPGNMKQGHLTTSKVTPENSPTARNTQWVPEPEATPETGPITSHETPPMFVLFRGGLKQEEGGEYDRKERNNPDPEEKPSNPPINVLFGGNPEPTGKPENGPEPERNIWDNDDGEKSGKENGSNPDPEVKPSTPKMNNLFGGNPEPTSEPENSPEPEGHIWDNDDSNDEEEYVKEESKPNPEKIPSTLPMNVLFGGNPEPTSEPENSPEPEGNIWDTNDDDNGEYGGKVPNSDPEKRPSTPEMNSLFGGNPEPTSEPENSPEPEGNTWDKNDDNDGEYEREEVPNSDPEKKPPTPEMNSLFGGNPEPTSEPENLPEPEGNIWDNGDGDDEEEYEKEELKPNPEKTPSTPPMNVLFGGNPEPTSEPENSPEPEGNIWDRNDDDDGEYGGEVPNSDPEKRPSTPEMNSLFGGKPELTSRPESTPEPEGDMWNHDDNEEDGRKEQSPSDSESTTSGPLMNALFGSKSEPTSDPDNTPEPEHTNSNIDGYGSEDQSSPDPEQKPPSMEPEPSSRPKNTLEPEDFNDRNQDKKKPKPTDMSNQDTNKQKETNQDYYSYYYNDMYSYDDDSTPPQLTTHTTTLMLTTTIKSVIINTTMVTPDPTAGSMPKIRNHVEDENKQLEPTPELTSSLEPATVHTTTPTASLEVMQPTSGDMMKTDRDHGEMPKPSPERTSKPLGLGLASRTCKNPIHKLPEGVSTSFERGDFGGWRNDSSAQRKWTLRKGPTSSPSTGPDSAYDGKYYVYLEGSRPSRQGDQAILRGPSGLGGCFCIKFACHMFVDKHSTLEMKVNGVAVSQNRYSHNDWQIMSTTIDDARESTVEIVATRGMTFRSDIAIDDIRIAEGMCPDHM